MPPSPPPWGGQMDTINITVTMPRPDLQVSTSTTTATVLMAGQPLTLSVRVDNLGSADASETTLSYYLSSDSTINSQDTPVGTDTVPSLNPNETSSQSVQIIAPNTSGDYYYGACVSPASGETNTDNNCSSAVRVTVSETPIPDLVVVNPSISNSIMTSNSILLPEQPFTLSVRVDNLGSGGGWGNSSQLLSLY